MNVLLLQETQNISICNRKPKLIQEIASYIKCRNYDLILLQDSPFSRTAAALLAASLHFHCYTNIKSFSFDNETLSLTRPAFQANLIASVETTAYPAVLTVQDETSYITTDTNIVSFEQLITPYKKLLDDSQLVSHTEKSSSEDIEHHPIVFVAGHAIRTHEEVESVCQAAKFSGAIVAASRPVVTDGLVPSYKLVGISGNHLHADVCVLLGVSGSQALMEGVRNCKMIFGINSDPDASVFKKCDVGCVTDFKTFIQAVQPD